MICGFVSCLWKARADLTSTFLDRSRHPLSARRGYWLPHAYVPIGGLFLGLMSFAGDVAPGPVGKIIVAVFSTGSAWCSLSAFAGYLYKRRLHSLLAAVGLLLLATLTYYGAIALSEVRFGGYYVNETDSGPVLSSADWLSEIASMARGVAFWAAASVIAGVAMGQLGYLIRNGSRVRCTAAIGLTFGITVAPAIHAFATILRFGVNPATSQLILPAICETLLACLVLISALAVRRDQIFRPLLVAISALSSVSVALIWGAVKAVQLQL